MNKNNKESISRKKYGKKYGESYGENYGEKCLNSDFI